MQHENGMNRTDLTHRQAKNTFKYALPEAYLHARLYLSDCKRGERAGSLRRLSLVMPIPFSKFNVNILWQTGFSCMRLVIPHSTVCPPFFHANHQLQTPIPPSCHTQMSWYSVGIKPKPLGVTMPYPVYQWAFVLFPGNTTRVQWLRVGHYNSFSLSELLDQFRPHFFVLFSRIANISYFLYEYRHRFYTKPPNTRLSKYLCKPYWYTFSLLTTPNLSCSRQ